MITKEQARTHREFYHLTAKNADGSAVRCRANGGLKTWKTRPDSWRLPVKYGLKQCFYLEPGNAADWTVDEPLTAKQIAQRELAAINHDREIDGLPALK